MTPASKSTPGTADHEVNRHLLSRAAAPWLWAGFACLLALAACSAPAPIPVPSPTTARTSAPTAAIPTVSTVPAAATVLPTPAAWPLDPPQIIPWIEPVEWASGAGQVVMGDDQAIWLQSLGSAAPRAIPGLTAPLALHPDGWRLAAALPGGGLSLVDLASGAASAPIYYPDCAARSAQGDRLAYLPDGRVLLARSKGYWDPSDPASWISVWDPAAQTCQRALELDTWLGGWDVSPDGRWLALTDQTGEISLWETDGFTPGCRLGGSFTPVHFDPHSGSLLVTLAGEVTGLDPATCQAIFAIQVGPAVSTWSDLARSPDGAWLAAVTDTGRLELYDAGGGLRWAGEPGEHQADRIHFSSAGDWLTMSGSTGLTAWPWVGERLAALAPLPAPLAPSGPTLNPACPLLAAAPVDDRSAWAAGACGQVWQVRPGGWLAYPALGSVDLTALAVVGPGDAWLAGGAGRTWHWNGTVWQPVDTPTPWDLQALSFTAPDDGWAAGGGWWSRTPRRTRSFQGQPVLLHWDGQAWRAIEPEWGPVRPYPLHSLVMVASNAGWAAGAEGLLRWDGQTWRPYTLPETEEIRWTALARGDGGTMWLAGLDLAAEETNPGGAEPTGVLYRWDGTGWRFFQSTRLPVFTLAGEWAGGGAADASGGSALLLRFDGTAWVEQPSLPADPIRALLPVTGQGVWLFSAQTVGEIRGAAIWQPENE